MKTKPRRGRIYLGVNLQSRILRRVATYWFLYHVALWQGMFLLDYVRHGDAFFNGNAPVPFWTLLRSFAWQNASLAIAAAAVGPLLLWDICRLTHRVAGPLLRLEKTLLRMAHGERVSPLICREGDLIQGVERAFNMYLASLDQREAAERIVRAAAGEAQPAPSPAQPESIDEEHEMTSFEFNALLRDINNSLQPVAPGQITL